MRWRGEGREMTLFNQKMGISNTSHDDSLDNTCDERSLYNYYELININYDLLASLHFREVTLMYRDGKIPMPAERLYQHNSVRSIIPSYRPYFYSLSKNDPTYVALFRLSTIGDLVLHYDNIACDKKLLGLKRIAPYMNYYKGYLLGLRSIREYKVANLDSLAYTMFKLKMGLMDIVYEGKKQIAVDIYESISCSGLPVLNRPMCDFERGFLTAAITSIYNREVETRETECWSTGSTKCRFIIQFKD